MRSPEIRKAVEWLIAIQNPDGGWGEDGTSYKLDYRGHEPATSTASQTAWALLGLMAGGEVGHPAVARGIRYLRQTQAEDGFWDEERFTATGFPRVFYLRYHGYRKFFPLWALARYRSLQAGAGSTRAVGHVRSAAGEIRAAPFADHRAGHRNRRRRSAPWSPRSSLSSTGRPRHRAAPADRLETGCAQLPVSSLAMLAETLRRLFRLAP